MRSGVDAIASSTKMPVAVDPATPVKTTASTDALSSELTARPEAAEIATAAGFLVLVEKLSIADSE